IFGQGAIRCHPFVEKEMNAVAKGDLVAFDRAFFGHICFTIANVFRAKWYALTGASFASAPSVPKVKCYFKQLTRMSTAFAVFADIAMGALGGDLKRKERLSSRFANILAWMYLASSSLKYYVDRGQQQKDLIFVRWCCQYSLHQIGLSFNGLFENFPNRLAAFAAKLVTFPFGISYRPPSDSLTAELSLALLYDEQVRDELTLQAYRPLATEQGLGRLEWARTKVLAAKSVETKIKAAVKAKKLDKAPKNNVSERALKAGVISQAEFNSFSEAEKARDEAIQVDAFNSLPAAV
ncbi:MAG: acyl-CoA dehydrogenase, partial [Bacteriovoracaceae bacterium]|nr:acyl-CoA dehydrogenase [Bacteriovoracaceae bacterium]